MNKLTRKINQSRIAILRKQLKRVNRMEHKLRFAWNETYDENKICHLAKYTPESRKIFRQEYSVLKPSTGALYFVDSMKAMRDLANRGDAWLLKAFNAAMRGIRSRYEVKDWLAVDMWKHTDRDFMVKAMYPTAHRRDFTNLDFTEHKRYVKKCGKNMITLNNLCKKMAETVINTDTPAIPSPEVAKAVAEQLSGMKVADWNDHDFSKPPANVFGNEKNYKVFPNIGELVGEDGVLMAHGEIPAFNPKDLHAFQSNLHDTEHRGRMFAQGSMDRHLHEDGPVLLTEGQATALQKDIDESLLMRGMLMRNSMKHWLPDSPEGLRDLVIVNTDGTLCPIDKDDPNPEATLREAFSKGFTVRHKANIPADEYAARKQQLVDMGVEIPHPLDFGRKEWDPSKVDTLDLTAGPSPSAAKQLTYGLTRNMKQGASAPAGTVLTDTTGRPVRTGFIKLVGEDGKAIPLPVRKSFLMRESDMREGWTKEYMAVEKACSGKDTALFAKIAVMETDQMTVKVEKETDESLIAQGFVYDAEVTVKTPMDEQLREQLYAAGFDNILPE